MGGLGSLAPKYIVCKFTKVSKSFIESSIPLTPADIDSTIFLWYCFRIIHYTKYNLTKKLWRILIKIEIHTETKTIRNPTNEVSAMTEVEIGDLVVEEAVVGLICIVPNAANVAMLAKYHFDQQAKNLFIEVIVLDVEVMKILKIEGKVILETETLNHDMKKSHHIKTAEVKIPKTTKLSLKI